MEKLGRRRVVELITDVVEVFGEDHVYDASWNGEVCAFERDGQPSCLVGHVLSRAGVSSASLESLDELTGRGFELRSSPAASVLSGVRPEVLEMLWQIQVRQDGGETWGECLHLARDIYEKEGD